MRNNGFICKFCPLYDKERRFYMKQKNRQINSIILADVYYDEINKEEKKKYCKKIQLKNLEKL
jgi:tryptophan synthase alpha subunit